MPDKRGSGSTAMNAVRIAQALRNTDEEHPITIQKLADTLGCHRHSVERTLSIMEIEYPEFIIEKCAKGIYYVKSDNDFDLYEIRMLCDSVLSSRIISTKETRTLISKLEILLNIYDRKRIRHIHTVSERIKVNHQSTMLNIDILGEAIEEKREIKFTYQAYDKRKELVAVGEYQVIPYQLVFVSGFYMSLCIDRNCSVRSFRIDMMKNINILDKNSINPEELYNQPEIEATTYVEGHPYMQIGKIERIVVEIDEDAIGRAIDAFGKDIRVDEADEEGKIDISFKANTEDVYLWALQNVDVAMVLNPQSLRDRLRVASENMNEKYLTTSSDWMQANLDAVSGIVRHGVHKRFNITSINIEEDYIVNALIQRNECGKVRTVKMHTHNDEVLSRLNRFYGLRNLIITISDTYGNDKDMIRLPQVLKQLPLKNLDCNCDALIDISVLGCCNELQKVVLSCENLKNADALSGLDELIYLDIEQTAVENIDFILKLPALKELTIGESVKDIEALYSATQIKRLNVPESIRLKLDMDRLEKANPNVSVW